MSSLPKSFKGVVINKANDGFVLQDLELKAPEANEVLVKVLACGVCFSDVAMAGGEMGNVFPRIPGHEIVGQVVAIGAQVSGFKVGERVGGPWHGGHDGHCVQCRRGAFQMCDAAAVNGVSRDGGFAEYVRLRGEAVVRVPSDMDAAEVAPLLCAGVTVFNGIRKMHVEQGALVAVQGLGGLGHLAVQYARHMGYQVAVLSSGGAGGDKEQFARQLGAHYFIDCKANDAAAQLTKLGGAAIIVQTAPSPDLVGPLVHGLAPEGKLLSLAPVGPISIDTVALVLKGRSVHGWPSGHALDSEEAIRFAAAHGVKCMIEKYPLSDVQRAVDDLKAGKPRFRNVLVME
ncbi:hypothetical protein CDD82_2965 [Ophiocordyceps australis]|uniref:Enoyl reductase (ER) domain-containing protein n=1 Tax=Ophiocordyceps australis TaxID=1399860 RepID=A0A2C5ZGL8_9HYPO|nr:hypothetical protein CDD82_2965 [Ophiocordyceps australis]